MHLRIIKGGFCKKITRKLGMCHERIGIGCMFFDQRWRGGGGVRANVDTYLKIVFGAFKREEEEGPKL